MKFLMWFQVATCLTTSPAHTGTMESGRNGAESESFWSGNKIESESFRVGNKLKIETFRNGNRMKKGVIVIEVLHF